MIALVDYGAGNLTSVRKALSALDTAFWTPSEPAELARARGIVVPGVGHFSATTPLDAAWRAAVMAALDRSVPLLGICVGMQWLFEGSTEAPDAPGLGLITGRCTHLRASEATGPDALKVPHVGWNSLAFPRPSRLFEGVADGSQVYFTHSYAAPLVAATAAVTTYGVAFSAAVEDGLVSGVQFHPEKSGDAGLRILKNWIVTL